MELASAFTMPPSGGIADHSVTALGASAARPPRLAALDHRALLRVAAEGPAHSAASRGAASGLAGAGAAAAAVATGVGAARVGGRRCRRSGHAAPAAVALRAATGKFSLDAPAAGELRFVAGTVAEGRPGAKVLHFLRHAEAEVNAAGRAFEKDDPRKKAVRLGMKYFDSRLSEKGLAACKELRVGTYKGRLAPPSVQLVLVSPLTRALQTATAVFGCGEAGQPSLISVEALREFCGKAFQPCDSRRDPKELSADFPHAAFENVPAGPDTLLGPEVVESPESADARIRWLLSWIRSRPETNIACVGHMQILTRVLAEHMAPAGWDTSAYEPLSNLDIRSVTIAFD